MSRSVCKHGVFMNIFEMGILITGESGIGKSEVALGLIHRGHQLIADDSVDIFKIESGRLVGRCPEVLQDFLEVRGLGIMNVRKLFSEDVLTHEKTLDLIVHLADSKNICFEHEDRLNGLYTTVSILDTDIPQVTLPVAPGRSLTILLETAVRNVALKNNGYHANEAFITRQHAFLHHSQTTSEQKR